MNNRPKPEISPAFTIDDIHKIREWNYERRKGMTLEEADADIHKSAERFKAYLATPVDPAIKAEVERRLASVEDKTISTETVQV